MFREWVAVKIKNALFACLLIAEMGPAQAGPAYSVTALGTLGGSDSYGWGINNSGQISGTSTTANGEFRAFMYSNGSMTDLGTLGGSHSYGRGINDAGQVVGEASTHNGELRSFLYSNGSMTDLGTFDGSILRALDVNNSGQITGYFSPAGSNNGFLYSSGRVTDLGSSAINVYINNSGEFVAGRSLYSNGSITDLGTLGGQYSYGTDINDAGQVVGDSTNKKEQTHAFLYSNGSMTDLGTLGGPGSFASGVNNRGQVVGWSHIGDSFSYTNVAFLYSDGRMHALDNLVERGWRIIDARAINDAGQIVGFGCSALQVCGALLLDPRDPGAIIPVPEPETYAMMLAGLGLLGVVARRRKQKLAA